jgi:hypothetical protein
VCYMVYAIIIFLLFPFLSMAATIDATDCTKAAIDTAITSASTGDTITIKGGVACTATWTSGVTIPDNKKLTIQGGGYTNTIITHSVTALNVGQSGSRITGIGFVQTSDTWSIEVKGSGWRFDHCRFTNTTGLSQVCIYPSGANITVPPEGLIDNNDFVQCRIGVVGMLTFSRAGTLWAAAPVLGTAGAIYVEDNTFYKTVGPGGGNVLDVGRGLSFVARYNTITGTTAFMAHGLQGLDERGAKSWEVYGNSFTSSQWFDNSIFEARAGTGVIFGNTHNENYGQGIRLYNDRSDTNIGGTAGMCDGASQWDSNELSSGWICRDQVGTGQDSSAWSDMATLPAPSQAKAPVYLFLNRNTTTGGLADISNGSSTHIAVNRDYYTEGASFNGTSGVGCGTLAAIPATCTTGVGYWATNQSCSSFTGQIGANPATPFSGTLYKCTSTNTWTSYYTPYTYPHPLQGALPTSATGCTLVGATLK